MMRVKTKFGRVEIYHVWGTKNTYAMDYFHTRCRKAYKTELFSCKQEAIQKANELTK